MSSPTELIVQQVASRMAMQLDQLLRSALNDHFGTRDWSPEHLQGRVARVVDNAGWETYTVDGVPFLRLGPVETPSMTERKGFISVQRAVERLRNRATRTAVGIDLPAPNDIVH